jgi:hypothetical protein
MKLETDIYVDSINGDNASNNSFITEEHLTYPFVDALKTNVDDHVDLPLDSRVDMCIYRIRRNKTSIPFLEFLLYLDGNASDKGGRKLTFPYLLYKHTKTGLVEQCAAPLRALFVSNEKESLDDVVKYDGYVYSKREKRCTLFFNQLYDEMASTSIPFMSSKNRWWWALSSEIFNEHQMMNYPMSAHVISFFNRNPSVMQLKAHGRTLESPSACYAGKHFNYISYMAAFGVKKASTRAHFGPYYYFVNFADSMMYACYSIRHPHAGKPRVKLVQFEPHVLSDGTRLTVNEHGKHARGGIARFAVFFGRCRAFFLNGDEDRSELSLFWANKDPFIKAKLALRDINGDWTRYFNSAYVGEYVFNANEETKKRVPGWTIKEYDNQIPLSCHEIDMKNVPDAYDPEFTDYELM